MYYIARRSSILFENSSFYKTILFIQYNVYLPGIT